MKKIQLLFVCSGVCLAVSHGVNAHHSFGAFYDMNEVVALEGEIKSVFWRNPHVRFTLDVIDEAGEVATWELEAGSVNTLERFGVDQGVIRVGATLNVWGPPSRHGLDTMFVVSVMSPGGEEVILNPNLASRVSLPSGITAGEALALDEATVSAAVDSSRSIFRVWTPRSRPTTGSGLHVWPLTEAGQAAKDAWDPLADDPALRCVPPGVPVAMDNPYPYDFTDNGDTIVMRLEEWDGVRTIHMDPGADASSQPPSHMGFSVGRWEENSLVVTTVDVNYPFFDDVGTPQSPDAEIYERFTLSDDESLLTWEATITDPVNFTEPATLNGVWVWSPGETIKPYECALDVGAP